MPLAPSSRARPSPDARAEDRALPSLRQERRPLSAPGAFAESSTPLPPAAFATDLRSARHSVRKRPPLQRRPPELLRPFDEVVSPTSPEPRLRPLNFFKEPELGRGLLVQLAAIEFSIREHDPRFVRIPSRDGRSAFRRPSRRRRRQEPFARSALPGKIAIAAARATSTTIPRYPDAPSDEHPASRIGCKERIEVSSLCPPFSVGRPSSPIEFVLGAAGV